MVLMRKHGTNATPRAAPVFMWLGPLAGFLKFGTDGYPRAVQRRLRIVNAMALLIAVFSVIYAAVFAYYDAEHYRDLIVVNLLLAVIVLLVPNLDGPKPIVSARPATLFPCLDAGASRS
jgi:peptidoglycan/LPS O-acetylase OafA/YrhL